MENTYKNDRKEKDLEEKATPHTADVGNGQKNGGATKEYVKKSTDDETPVSSAKGSTK